MILGQPEAVKGLQRDACRTIFARWGRKGKAKEEAIAGMGEGGRSQGHWGNHRSRGEEERRGPNDVVIDQMWRYPTERGKILGFLLEQINK